MARGSDQGVAVRSIDEMSAGSGRRATVTTWRSGPPHSPRGPGRGGESRVAAVALLSSVLWASTVAAAAGPDATAIPALTKESKPASLHTRALAEKARSTLPFHDEQDFELARRGLVATLPEPYVRDAHGEIVRDLSGWDLFAGAAPDTVHPSLWRFARLQGRAGLYRVTERIYQVRGVDVANMTVMLGERGYIIVDPLLATESAKAALDLVRAHLGDRPVTAVLITHSHTDHYGGVKGVVSEQEVTSGEVPLVAPEGFLREVVRENIIAGPAMSRRLTYMFGTHLPYGARGAVNYGVGPVFKSGFGKGTISLIAPTHEVARTGERLTLDGVDFEFQLTPDSEAPAEMIFYLPQFRALCMAELATNMMHNVLTLRGATVRDAKKWADYLTEALQRYGSRSDVVFASHHWPRWGGETIVDYLSMHRDAYKFLHDQTVRMMNQGLTAAEIAEAIELPEVLAHRWFNRGYYGTMSHNSKAIHQRYLGWYDGNPANLQPLPPEAAAARYVRAMGGVDSVMARARSAVEAGEYRWAAELLKHVVFAEPAHRAAQLLLADALEQLGYQAESSAWRNVYLTGALELRHGKPKIEFTVQGGSLANVPLEELLDLAAVRLDPAIVAGREWRLAFNDSGTGKRHVVTVRNDVLVHTIDARAPVSIEISATAPQFAQLLSGADPAELAARGKIRIRGEISSVKELVRALPPPPRDFDIVTP